MLFIAGQWRQAQNKTQFSVQNPSTGETIATVADASPLDTEQAIDGRTQSYLHGVQKQLLNAPFIVFDHADIQLAVSSALSCKLRNTG
ncbi:hypothetical protein [Agaribacterium sp. ZY112]|uniref:hypothetical protein n=1 Tax=Agaribacterium sp. ZY112 TaxID=3233574 RepID=UPI0035253754